MMKKLNEQVTSELLALQDLGIPMPPNLIAYVADMDLREYDNMSVGEIADLLIMLRKVK